MCCCLLKYMNKESNNSIGEQYGNTSTKAMLPGYADMDTGTRYGDTLICYFSKNKDTGIHTHKFQGLYCEKIEISDFRD